MNTQLIFDDKGCLAPSGIISCDLETFADTFLNLQNTVRRHKIYSQYQQYLSDLKTTLGEIPFIHWVNGSFVTKKTLPSDIDVVTFLPIEYFEKLGNALSDLQQPSVSMKYGGIIDAYILPDEIFHKAYWEGEFTRVKGKDKRPVIGQKKGFIQIIFQTMNDAK